MKSRHTVVHLNMAIPGLPMLRTQKDVKQYIKVQSEDVLDEMVEYPWECTAVPKHPRLADTCSANAYFESGGAGKVYDAVQSEAEALVEQVGSLADELEMPAWYQAWLEGRLLSTAEHDDLERLRKRLGRERVKDAAELKSLVESSAELHELVQTEAARTRRPSAWAQRAKAEADEECESLLDEETREDDDTVMLVAPVAEPAVSASQVMEVDTITAEAEPGMRAGEETRDGLPRLAAHEAGNPEAIKPKKGRQRMRAKVERAHHQVATTTTAEARRAT